MNRASHLLYAGIIGVGLAAIGYVTQHTAVRADDRTGGPVAVATIHSAGDVKETITGTVTFTSHADGVRIIAAIDGLSPGKHGFHIHEKTDLSSPDLKSAGGHFNPDGHKHGGPDSPEHHAGDLGNLVADEKGHAHLDFIDKDLTIEGSHGVVGHSVIIHANEDDLKTDPSGESGGRIAGGVIALATQKDEHKDPNKK